MYQQFKQEAGKVSGFFSLQPGIVVSYEDGKDYWPGQRAPLTVLEFEDADSYEEDWA